MLKVGTVIFKNFRFSEKKDKWFFLNYGIYRFQRMRFDEESSHLTHVMIVLEVRENTLIIGHSIQGGFQIQEWGYKDIERKILCGDYIVRYPEGIKTTNLKSYAEGMIGTPYGYFDLFRFMLLYGLNIDTFEFSTKQKVCSESVSTLLQMCGYPVKSTEISPAALYILL